jgi:crotonobetainyl-CoA:carnitine CoA-transferase CaiB-like acyl-CoA transferase
MSGALDGVLVLDFTRVLAGPFATMMLADLGADVIKVESLTGDDTRQWGPPWLQAEGQRESAYFLSVNRSKRSIALNLKHAEGQQLARDMAAIADVVVENLRPGGMTAFGLGFRDLQALNPALVYASITGYGQTGPYSERPGYDFVIQAQSGLMSITGPADGEPYKVGVAISDVVAGLFAATSILAALRHSERTGQGQHLDIALFDTTIAALVNVVSSALISGDQAARYGNAHANIVPYQLFDAQDRPFALAVGNDRQFEQLCILVGHPEWSADERFQTNPARVAHRDALIAELQRIFARRAADAWTRDLLAFGIPAGPLNDVQTMLADPQVQARALVTEADWFGQALRMIGPPVGYSVTPAQPAAAPPALGQHTDDILQSLLKLDAAAIRALRSRAVVG